MHHYSGGEGQVQRLVQPFCPNVLASRSIGNASLGNHLTLTNAEEATTMIKSNFCGYTGSVHKRVIWMGEQVRFTPLHFSSGVGFASVEFVQQFQSGDGIVYKGTTIDLLRREIIETNFARTNVCPVRGQASTFLQCN